MTMEHVSASGDTGSRIKDLEPQEIKDAEARSTWDKAWALVLECLKNEKGTSVNEGVSECIRFAETDEEWSKLKDLIVEYKLWRVCILFEAKCTVDGMASELNFERRLSSAVGVFSDCVEKGGQNVSYDESIFYDLYENARTISDKRGIPFERIAQLFLQYPMFVKKDALINFRNGCPEHVYSDFSRKYIAFMSTFVRNLNLGRKGILPRMIYYMHLMMDVGHEGSFEYIEDLRCHFGRLPNSIMIRLAGEEIL